MEGEIGLYTRVSLISVVSLIKRMPLYMMFVMGAFSSPGTISYTKI